jgi:hypothetical protein
MTYPVITLPQTILCGKCGNHMRSDSAFGRIDKPLIVRCYSTQCEHYDIALVFPVTLTELQRAEA